MTRAFEIAQVTSTPRPTRIMWSQDDGTLFLGTDDGTVLRWDSLSHSCEVAAPSPLRLHRRAIGRSRLVSRLLRQGPRAFLRTSSGTLLWTAGGCLWRMAAGDEAPRLSFAFAIGHGPLFLAATPDGSVYWGDYVARREPRPSCVYCSTDDGRRWEVVFRFETNVIRHIHGVFWDQHGQQLWLTTGDEPSESALWTFDGEKPRRIVSGRQFRIVQPIFSPDHIVFGTDLPGEQNRVCAIERQTGRVADLIATVGPVFFAHRAGENAAFSTSVEPLHGGQSSSMYVGSLDTFEFREVLSLKKDRWPMRLFQYGQLFLPQNGASAPDIWFTPCATMHDGCLIRYRPTVRP